MVVAAAYPDEIHVQVAGGGDIPDRVADVDDLLDLFMLSQGGLGDRSNDGFPRPMAISSAEENGIQGNTDVFELYPGGAFPAASSDAEHAIGAFSKMVDRVAGAGDFLEFFWVGLPFFFDIGDKLGAKIRHFLRVWPALEVFLDHRIKDRRIRDGGVAFPINGRERQTVYVLVGICKALTIYSIRIDKCAVNIKNYQFHAWLFFFFVLTKIKGELYAFSLYFFR